MFYHHTHFVYFIISPKGKIYIGYTKLGADKRFERHVENSRKEKKQCVALEEAIRKYEPGNMTVIEVRKCYSKEEAKYWEIRYIATKNTLSPNGYNLTRGGDGGISVIREPASVETKSLIGAAAKGRGAKGVIGYHILGYTVEFDVIKDAAKCFGIEDGDIGKSAKGKRGRVGGFIWEYKDEEERSKYPKWDITRRKGAKGRPVYRILEDGTKDEYPSTEKAACILGLTRSNIDRSVRTELKAYGYRWFYV
ncbi:GIY-YIG catalytic domain-containing endonuclease [Paramecium bursaria Chlorella virus CvsA1]|nr:GIY-YIG catalytic domain-containing endonuclease [Paramecium bursaria Chlorella virus CviKI]AGE52537.1 GIY-YIG catalytic domain-containing endonuclease [Paramecium bursaria Chlorella virus CvsA1]AGE55300.1 GIY-YIG catalytic domain-containing endonuclease [Paramecium bursaria Chlorella virus MA1E]